MKLALLFLTLFALASWLDTVAAAPAMSTPPQATAPPPTTHLIARKASSTKQSVTPKQRKSSTRTSASSTASAWASSVSSGVAQWNNEDPNKSYSYNAKLAAPTVVTYSGSPPKQTPVPKKVKEISETSFAKNSTSKATSRGFFGTNLFGFSKKEPVVYQYHGTCRSNFNNMHKKGLILQPQEKLHAPNDFSYKGGFYMTPSFENARRYVLGFKDCSEEGGRVVIKFRLKSKGIRVLEAGKLTDKAKNFWNIQFDIGFHLLSNEAIPKEVQKYMDDVDNSDVITGTVEMDADHTADLEEPPTNPFDQVVAVTQAGMNALEIVELIRLSK